MGFRLAFGNANIYPLAMMVLPIGILVAESGWIEVLWPANQVAERVIRERELSPQRLKPDSKRRSDRSAEECA